MGAAGRKVEFHAGTGRVPDDDGDTAGRHGVEPGRQPAAADRLDQRVVGSVVDGADERPDTAGHERRPLPPRHQCRDLGARERRELHREQPTAPAAPVTRTRCPAWTAASSCTEIQAEVAGEKKQDARTGSAFSGAGCTASSGTAAYSAATPSRVTPSPPPRSHTSAPRGRRRTPRPAGAVAAGDVGQGRVAGKVPEATLRSRCPSTAAATRTRVVLVYGGHGQVIGDVGARPNSAIRSPRMPLTPRAELGGDGGVVVVDGLVDHRVALETEHDDAFDVHDAPLQGMPTSRRAVSRRSGLR